jgi:ABC-type transporter Mla subunit MlaD
VDQQRINETLRTIDRTTALYSRLLTKLNDQETQLEKLRADEDDATKQLNDASQQLRDFLTNLNVG